MASGNGLFHSLHWKPDAASHETMKADELFELSEALDIYQKYFPGKAAPWEWVEKIGEALEKTDLEGLEESQKDIPRGLEVRGAVYIHKSVTLPSWGHIEGPVHIGPGCELRPGVYIRGNVIAGKGCVLGNSCEFKNALLMDFVQVPHFSYVGDSVLGARAHLGAGAILSNLRFDQEPVSVWTPEGKRPSGLKKLGGLVGDGAELGCHAVLQPGSVIGRRSLVMTGMVFNGYLEPETLAYTKNSILRVRRRDL